MVGVQLGGQDLDDRRQPGRDAVRQGEALVDVTGGRRVGDDQQARAVLVPQAGQQGDLGVELGAARGHRQDRYAGLSQRERPVLEVGRRVGHGGDQGHLLELERPFAGARVAVAATEDDGTIAGRMRGGQFAPVGLGRERGRHQGGQPSQVGRLP